MTDHRITLAEIAALAEVSPSTVSKVLNQRDDVAASTRRRVQAVLDRENYAVPGRRMPAVQDHPLVDFVTSNLDNAYGVEVLRGVVRYAESTDVEVVVSRMPDARVRRDQPAAWAERVVASGRRGMILVTSDLTAEELAEFRARSVSLVVIDPLNPLPGEHVSVGSTNWAGGRTAVDHLIEHGHRRIGYIGGPESAECNTARFNGYLGALRAAGIAVRDEYITGTSFGPEAGIAGLRHFMALEEPPTAVFAGSDSTAVGLIQEARRLGVRIPEDLSIVGYDGTSLSEQTVPRLTTVQQPLQEMGRTALRLVLSQAAGDDLGSHHIELATHLIERDSVATLTPAP
ncbi:LacI family transcriptional regulator [Mycetocola tolaasinivorans]|uniref:LacI family transcriptional regulator n=1 Tax=Mycetocola tolaasinivorans TaxID=76635 RepID=A0A3L7A7D4_9MICO|nr:LacI family DNA-binding transcriptional regulator [Mycetocola tolaasinivorans]RLP76054.1 LacI family transcriptional regulator [Mycetocola tolaasinivorans]